MNQDHKKLHEKFSTLGRERNRLTYELLAMLPQIYDEGVYREHKCATIYEYAGKYAGLSHSVVEKTLKLHLELEGKPFLREAIKTEGVHKVSLVARLATSETDKILARRVVNMSKPALQELSKELRQKVEINQITIEQAIGEEAVNSRLCHAAQESMTISLDPEMQFMFLKLKKRFEKSLGVNLSNKQGLKIMLEELCVANAKSPSVGSKLVGTERSREVVEVGKMADDIAYNKIKNSARQEKRSAVKNFPGEKVDKSAGMLSGDVTDASDLGMPGRGGKKRADFAENNDGEITECINCVRAEVKKIATDIFKRYIPVKTRRLAIAKTTGGCAYPGCNRPYENFHHCERFVSGGRHDSIVPVCLTHHEFAHNGLVRGELKGAEKWELDLSGGGSFADKRYVEYRK